MTPGQQMISSQNFFRILVRIFYLLLLLTVLAWQSKASAAQFQLTWTDNSSNEDGFSIDRKTGTTGTYAQIASVGANVTAYADLHLAAATTYCYRVLAFNPAGNSPYTPEECGTTAAVVQTFSLTGAEVGLCIVAISLLAIAITRTLKQWRKRRMMERGITDLVSRVRS